MFLDWCTTRDAMRCDAMQCDAMRCNAKADPTASFPSFLSFLSFLPTFRLSVSQARTCMSSALRDVLCACYESGGTDEATGSQLAPKMQVYFQPDCRVLPSCVLSIDSKVLHVQEYMPNVWVESAQLRANLWLDTQPCPHHGFMLLHRRLWKQLPPSRSSWWSE